VTTRVLSHDFPILRALIASYDVCEEIANASENDDWGVRVSGRGSENESENGIGDGKIENCLGTSKESERNIRHHMIIQGNKIYPLSTSSFASLPKCCHRYSKQKRCCPLMSWLKHVLFSLHRRSVH
jgi:hypothetical protein